MGLGACIGILIFDIFLFFGYSLPLVIGTRRQCVLREYKLYLGDPNFRGLFNGDIKARERTKKRAKYVLIASFIVAIVAALEPLIFENGWAILITLSASAILYAGGNFYYGRCIADEILEKEIAKRRKAKTLK